MLETDFLLYVLSSAWIPWYIFSTLFTIFRPIKSTLYSVFYTMMRALMIAMPDIRLFPSPALSFKVAPPPKKWQLWIWGRGTGGISWKGNYVGEGEVRWLSWCLNETAAGKYISNFQYWIYTAKKAQRAKILRRAGNDDWGEVRWLSCLNENLRKVQDTSSELWFSIFGTKQAWNYMEKVGNHQVVNI